VSQRVVVSRILYQKIKKKVAVFTTFQGFKSKKENVVHILCKFRIPRLRNRNDDQQTLFVDRMLVIIARDYSLTKNSNGGG
jgi:hypothetical protein